MCGVVIEFEVADSPKLSQETENPGYIEATCILVQQLGELGILHTSTDHLIVGTFLMDQIPSSDIPIYAEKCYTGINHRKNTELT